VLSALPTFFLFTFKVPISILDQADKYKKMAFGIEGILIEKGLSSSMKKCNSPKMLGRAGYSLPEGT
jgi:hypothetical protein